MDHAGKAQNLFREGYNCAQAVAGAFSEELGMDPALAMRLVAGFGGGMGRLREVCGGVSGILMAAGLLYGYTAPDNDEAKAAHYALVQELAEEFRRENGSIICRELLGRDGPEAPVPEKRTAAYYAQRPCARFVGSAAAILERYMAQHPPLPKQAADPATSTENRQ